MRGPRSALLMIAMVALSAAAARAETRVALVIGNSNYDHVTRLANPENDAEAITAALKRVGFSVDKRKNVRADELRVAILRFADQAQSADVAVVYYAGHGIQVDGVNYLIPVDAALKSAASLSLEAVPADSILGAVQHARRLRLLILDACRDNPFKAQLAAFGARGPAVRGLAPIGAEGTGDTLIAYSAKDNTVAQDGTGANSPYAAALARRLGERGVEIDKLFREVRDDVLAETRGAQEPFIYGSRSSRDFYFLAPSAVQPSPQSAPLAAANPAEMDLWDSVKNSNDLVQLQSYLDQFPQGTFAGAARAKINALREAPSQHVQRPSAPGSMEATKHPPASGRAPDTTITPTLLNGASAFDRRDFSAALQQLLPLAENGNAFAQCYVAVMYLDGKGAQKDPRAAVEWFRLSADAGVADAQNYLGTIYRKGEIVPRDYRESMRWYLMAAKQNYENAQYRIGLMYEQGLGVSQDNRQAYVWATISSVEGQPEPINLRKRLARLLTPAQIAEGDREAAAWRAKSMTPIVIGIYSVTHHSL